MSQIQKASLDEIVFEGREQAYGGYFLRKKYVRHLSWGLLIVALVFSLSTTGALIGMKIKASKAAKKAKTAVNVSLTMADLPPPPPMDDEKPPPPPPPEKPPPPQVKTVSFKIPEPTPEDELPPDEENTITEMDSLKEAPNIDLVDREGDDRGLEIGEIDGEGDVPEVIQEEKPKEVIPDINAFVFVQEEPKPVNMDDIRKAIGYPQIARDAGIEGTVVIRILVDEYGNYKKHKVTKQEHPILAKACEAQVGKLKFTPAIQGGKPIKFWVNIPFKFTLLN
jgi:protein TonB